MKSVTYKTSSVCASKISFDISDENTIHNLVFHGGCPGNTQAISNLCEGKTANELITVLKGIRCGYRPTSCADQLVKGIEESID